MAVDAAAQAAQRDQAVNGVIANNPVVIRAFTEADEEVIRRMVPAGLSENFLNYVFSILFYRRVPLLSCLLVPCMAILARPSQAPLILTLTFAGAMLAFAAFCVYLRWEIKKYLGIALSDDLKGMETHMAYTSGSLSCPVRTSGIAHKYSGSGFGPGSAFWVAEVGGEIVGCVGLQRHSSDRAELRRLSISKNARRQGIGVKLVRQLVAHAVEHGFKEVFLSTSSGQPAAIALYIRNGWQLTKETKAHGLRILHFAMDITKAS